MSEDADFGEADADGESLYGYLYFDFIEDNDYSNDEGITLVQGKKMKLMPHLVNAESRSLKWSSSNNNIVTVSESGVVKAIKPGKAKVTARDVNDKSEYDAVCFMVYKKAKKADVKKALKKLKSKYPEGKSWGDNKSYAWGQWNMYCFGCWALASKISDEVFGKYAPLKEHHSYNKIKVGDIVAYPNGCEGDHAFIVLSKTKKSLKILEGNYNHKIHWGRSVTRAKLRKAREYTVWTRY